MPEKTKVMLIVINNTNKCNDNILSGENVHIVHIVWRAGCGSRALFDVDVLVDAAVGCCFCSCWEAQKAFCNLSCSTRVSCLSGALCSERNER